MNSNQYKPGPDLYLLVRTGFTLQGTSLNKWCIDNDVKRQNALSCLNGLWNGPKGQALRQKLITASQIDSLPEAMKQNVQG